MSTKGAAVKGGKQEDGRCDQTGSSKVDPHCAS